MLFTNFKYPSVFLYTQFGNLLGFYGFLGNRFGKPVSFPWFSWKPIKKTTGKPDYYFGFLGNQMTFTEKLEEISWFSGQKLIGNLSLSVDLGWDSKQYDFVENEKYNYFLCFYRSYPTQPSRRKDR